MFNSNAKKRYNKLFIKILILFHKFEIPFRSFKIPNVNNTVKQ